MLMKIKTFTHMRTSRKNKSIYPTSRMSTHSPNSGFNHTKISWQATVEIFNFGLLVEESSDDSLLYPVN